MLRRGLFRWALSLLAAVFLLGGCARAGAPATSAPAAPITPTSSPPPASPPAGQTIIVRQAGGLGSLLASCQDKAYVSAQADYIIEGTVTGVRSGPGSDGTGIYTYSDIAISRFAKGTPIGSAMQIITAGGTSGGVGLTIEDQPILHQGKQVRLYLKDSGGQLAIVCGTFGVEEIK